jgi:arsenical pump membrane protein
MTYRSLSLPTYPLIILIFGLTAVTIFGSGIEAMVIDWFSPTTMNPLQIIIIFFSCTFLALYLDEVGLIRYLAYASLKHAQSSQTRLFFMWTLLVSILTIFTANDIVILTLTPFIIYFAKQAKIVLPAFLVVQFVAANTWSMLLMIGNPTNLYIARSFDISFLNYALKMFLPTIIISSIAVLLVYALFKKNLSKPMGMTTLPITTYSHPQAWLGSIHLALGLLGMAIAPWLRIDLGFIISVVAFSLITLHALGFRDQVLITTFKRLPWDIIPFLIGMASLVVTLSYVGLNTQLVDSLKLFIHERSWGVVAFLFGSVMNNIPMSIWFADMLALAQVNDIGIYSVIIASNLVAIVSPLGALAGIMWLQLLKQKSIDFNTKHFLQYGLVLGVVLMAVSLVVITITF